MTQPLGSCDILISSSLAAALPAANAAIAPKPVANSTLRIVNPPILELWVSAKRPSSSIFLVHIPIPFENGKLAQERSRFARKRNQTNYLAFGLWILLAAPPPRDAAAFWSVLQTRNPRLGSP